MTNANGKISPGDGDQYQSGFATVVIDEKLRARAQAFIDTEHVPIAELARSLGARWDRSTLSRYLAGKYGQVEGIEAALRTFFARRDRVAGGELFVETRIAGLIMEHCEFALRARALVVIAGPPGNGKTTAAGEFMRRQLRGGNTAMVFITASSLSTSSSILSDIAAELGLKHRRTQAEMLGLVIAELKGHTHLLIVDDAGFLNVRTLEALRAIYDQAACGLILMGTRTLLRTFEVAPTSRLYEDLGQLFSRVDLVERIPEAVSKKEAAQMIARRCPWMAAGDVETLAGDAQNPRSVMKRLGQIEHIRGCYQRAGKAAPPVAKLAEVADQRIFQVA